MLTSSTTEGLTNTAKGIEMPGAYVNADGGEVARKLQNMTNEMSVCTTASAGAGFPVWKRVLDVWLILVGAPIWIPVALLITLVIRAGSRGPILFRQQRVGQGGRVFVCFKFRTMHIDASQTTHQHHMKDLIKSSIPMVKLDDENDSRLIRGGAWIRASGLDELAQILNILRGEMSLVGPRPCIPYEFEMYEPWQRSRCDAPPGLTGLWQVSGKNRTTFNEMVQLDISYSRRMSPWLDLGILMRTPMAILQQIVDLRMARKARRAPIRD